MLVKDELIIRAVQRDDIETIYKWKNQKSRGLFQEFHFDSYINIEKEFEKNGFNTDKFKMLIVELENKDKIGLVYINFLRAGLVRIGLVIANKTYRSKGYGKRVTKIIVNNLFDNYPIERIEASTDNKNISAQKVLEEAGFLKEGILRNYMYHHKEWRDFALYSILRNEVLGLSC